MVSLLSKAAVVAILLGAATAWPYQTFNSSPFTPPVLEITKSGAELSPGYLLLTIGNLTNVGTIDPAPIMMSDTGELIWNGPVSTTQDVTNLFVQTLNGEDVLTYWSGTGDNTGHGYGSVTILNSSYDTIAAICPSVTLTTNTGTYTGCPVDLHEALITADNTILVTMVNATQADLSSIGGSANGWVWDTMFMEIDIATGEILFQWSPLAAGIKVTDSRCPLTPPGFTSGSRLLPYDFFHVNSVMKRDDGGYIVNSRHTCAMYGLSSTGEIEWTFDGVTGGDFGTLPAGGNFSWQHHVRLDSQSPMALDLHLFNDQNYLPTIYDPTQTTPSNGLLFHLDLTAKTAALTQTFIDKTDLRKSYSQGSYDAQPNGNVILGYGSEPVLKEFGPAGDVRMSVVFGNETVQSYRAYRREWSGSPRAYGPSVVASKARGMGWVSWNGDTRTTSWVVLAGPSAGRLVRVGEVCREGFETAFEVPGNVSFVQVQAFEGRTLLRSSEVVAVGV